jgi:choline dehydrogenase
MTRTMQAETVVVGGGSSGCVVAARLAEAGRDVLLVEAGPDYGPLDSGRWPAELVDARMLATTHDWGYQQGRWTFERARVIGGCSAHNGAIAAVGHRSDYTGWAIPGWSGNDVEIHFRAALERMRVRTYRRDEAGPFHARCLDAAEAAGWRMADDLCDLDANDSFGLESVNVVGATRWNAAFAYLDPVRAEVSGHGHLRILDRVLVDRLDGGAVGGAGSSGVRVHAERAGEQLVIEAGTVVLAAGVYGTPAILQRSGVGPPEVLRAAGVDVRVDLPGVGANLHDHPMVHADRAVGDELQAWLDAAAATGYLPEEQTLGKALSSKATGLYDLHVFPVCASDQTSLLHGRVHVEVACMTPVSRGRVSIASPDPSVAPLIDHAYLSDVDGHDLAVLRDGLVLAEELLAQPVLASLLGGALTDMSTDAAIRSSVVHYYHPVGTCAMGPDDMAVCDGDARVRGLGQVLVADASLMPRIPRANTNLPTVMIGEAVAARLLGMSSSDDTVGT